MKRLGGLFVPLVAIAAIVALSAALSDASEAAAQRAPEASAPRSRTRTPATMTPTMTTETRGEQVFGQHCAFCHGADARGGAQGGVDLLLSSLVLDDEGGAGLAKFLAVGRPEKNMPKFDLPRPRIAEIAAWLHARVGAASSSRVKVDILVGDPKAGAAYFNGPGRCTTCHSVTGDLARIGAKYDPVLLQGRMVVPRGRGGYPGGDNEGDLPLRATVMLPSGTLPSGTLPSGTLPSITPPPSGALPQGTPPPGGLPPATPQSGTLPSGAQPSGQSVTGDVVYLSDFYITLKDASGRRHTIERRGDEPKVDLLDPLHAHVALLRTLSDSTMHDLTAFLASLK